MRDLAERKEWQHHHYEPDEEKDYNTIGSKVKPREDEAGSSIFISKTKRGHSISEVPGPGAYNTNFNHEIFHFQGK